MENTIGAANWLVGKVLNKLSNGLVAAYVASSELGLNSEKIKTKLKYMQGLLHFAQERDVSNNPGLHSLLQDLSKKADEAEDALDELHYFMIQDQLDSTQDAAPDLGDDLRSRALHGVHAASHTIGNSLPCSSCSRPGDFPFLFEKDNAFLARVNKMMIVLLLLLLLIFHTMQPTLILVTGSWHSTEFPCRTKSNQC
ncbi:hypothetical protein ACQ4PT_026923 [Festuca glaucescens]